MLWVFADNHYLALAADDFALFANGLYRRSDFHCKPPLFRVVRESLVISHILVAVC